MQSSDNESAAKIKLPEIFNYRPIAYAAASLAVGIALGALGYKYFAVSITVAALLLIAVIVALVRKMRVSRIIAIAATIGFILSFATLAFTPVTAGKIEYAYVEARITAISRYDDSARVYVLNELNVNGDKVNGKASMRLDGSATYEVGDLVAVCGGFETLEFDPFDGYSVSAYSSKIKHTVFADMVEKRGESKLGIIEYLRVKIADRLVTFMGDEAGGAALALVIGDKSRLSAEVRDDLRASGLSHLIAVSGLHVGFLSGIMYAVFRLLKRSKSRSILVVACVLGAYSVLTGFQTGVVRATIMCLCFLYALRKEERYDPLNALSLSVIIILMISPFDLFDVGFLMSIGSVLGIICFYPSFYNLFVSDVRGARTANRFASAMCVSVSANTYLLGITASVFGTFALYFVIANVIAVPYVSLIYFFLVPITALSVLIEPLGYLMIPFKYLIYGFIGIADLISSLPLALIPTKVSTLVAAIYCITLFFISKFNLLGKKVKITVASVAFVIIIVLIVL